ncbi:hypothetical protein [Pedobacter foliorum]|uniref:hypothetical protein n=1 Tax=Pedobacter foliorum TaxID=2739058 RepID=UPI001565D7AA|nr:hypothetical protein [Pedobacter foliorum]NRF40702.1 hypothetical protein [Pedobacter foliorum]
MKKSRKPTNHVMIKAYTRSKFNNVQFAILHISENWAELINEHLEAIRDFKQDFYVRSHVFWCTPLKFCENPVGERLPEKILPRLEDWAFITLGPEEEKTLPELESDVGYHELIITKHGIAHYKAHGGHLGEVFLTEEFNLYKLLAKL